LNEYSTAAVLRFEKAVAQPEDRHAWSNEVNQGLLELERAVFLSGYQKAFLLPMNNCHLCADCSAQRETCKVPRSARAQRETCKVPRSARPAPEAMAIDVFSTVRRLGYPIQVLTDYDQAMNRYAFLLIE
jgi:predicted metal-binding protein